jgi:hypothetical protein
MHEKYEIIFGILGKTHKKDCHVAKKRVSRELRSKMTRNMIVFSEIIVYIVQCRIIAAEHTGSVSIGYCVLCSSGGNDMADSHVSTHNTVNLYFSLL